jgi:pimeloyl-ACP methyl ester carboxylesterase
VFLPEYSHFIPMEAPGLIAQHVAELASTVR